VAIPKEVISRNDLKAIILQERKVELSLKILDKIIITETTIEQEGGKILEVDDSQIEEE